MAIVDISHHQNPKNIDYAKFCNQLEMAIIRVQYGSNTIDRYYKTHISEMKKHGIPFGVYAWVRGNSIADMETEAQHFFDRSKDHNPLFYVLDVEEKSMSDMRSGISAYVRKLRTLTDKKIGIYVAHHYYKPFNLNLSEVDFVWIPRYGANSGQVHGQPPAYNCDLWQYTSKGRLNGYAHDLDSNKIMGNKTVEFFTGKAEPKPTEPISSDKLVEDGIMGVNTKKALQKALGVAEDGIVGKGTIKALQKKLNDELF